jgi:uroporphyrinogen-III synthase
LWESLRRDAGGARRICYPRSSRAAVPREVVGVEISSPVLYETVARAFDLYVTQRSDVVAVASPSAAEALKDVPMLPRSAALGPTTAGALRRIGVEPWLEMREAGFEEFARGIAERIR